MSYPDNVPCEGIKCVLTLVSEGKVKSLSITEKKELIKSHRPTPDLIISQTCKTRVRKFNRSVYKTRWIVGCSHSNKLYCWYCILFSNEKTSWTTSGYDDLNNLTNAVRRHETSQKHMSALLSFVTFGKQYKEPTLTGQLLSDAISRHNMQVDHNRSVFQRLVDVVCHLAQQELPFSELNVPNTSVKKGNFLELLSLLSKYDLVLEKQNQRQMGGELQSGLSYLSIKIQNDIIQSVADVLRSQISFELKTTNFVSIIIDEIPNTCNTTDPNQVCLILRYYFGGDIHDRFLGYINVSEHETLDALSSVILDFLMKNDCHSKVVAQSYDCASTMSGIRNEIQQKVKDVCPLAIFSWCNANNLNSVLYKSCCKIAEVRWFFSGLNALIIFFCTSSKRANFYHKYCNKSLPDTPATYWTNASCIVKTVFDQRENLIQLFFDIYEKPHDWDGDTMLAADNFYNLLRSFNFNFFLSLFHAIFGKTDLLHHIIQESHISVEYCQNKIKDFLSWLCTELPSKFDLMYENALLKNLAPHLRHNTPCAHTEFKRIFVEVTDNIYSEINCRYSEIFKLEFFQLLNVRKYGRYKTNFPEAAFDSLLMVYAGHFEELLTRNQLISLYSSAELQPFHVFGLIDFMHENNLDDAFPELFKLAQLIVTIPATTFSMQRAFSSLNNVHTYLRNTHGQERHSDLSMVAIEKQLLIELKRSPKFYSDVIKSFLQKNRHFSLEYK